MNLKRIILTATVILIIFTCLSVVSSGDYKTIDNNSILGCNATLVDSDYSFGYTDTHESTDYAYYSNGQLSSKAYYFYTKSSGTVRVNISNITFDNQTYDPDIAQKHINDNFRSDLEDAVKNDGITSPGVTGPTLWLDESENVTLDGDILTFTFNETSEIHYTSEEDASADYANQTSEYGDYTFDFYVDPKNGPEYHITVPMDDAYVYKMD